MPWFHQTSPENKGFVKGRFCEELDQLLIQGNIYKSEDPYSKLTDIFKEISDKYAPLKPKEVRGNQAVFMNKDLTKVIMNTPRLKNRYLESLSSCPLRK